MSQTDDDTNLKRVKKLAKLLDSNFQIGPFKFGWDSILGLVPGVGDSLASFVSSYVVYEAVSKNMSKATIARMIINIVIDSVVGSLPFLGDLGDIFWKANEKNALLYEKELKNPGPSSKFSALWLFFAGMALLGAVIFSIYVPIKILQLLLNL